MAAPVQSQPYVLHEDGIWRDSVRQPLYSTVGLNGGAAVPQELAFFNYAKGQNVPGAGDFAGVTSSIFHTNMDSAGQLGRPKKFRCDGVRLHLVPIASSAANTPAVSDAGFGAAAVNDDLLEDWLVIFYSCTLSLKVGEKYYLNHPTWFAPSNVGFDGLAAVAGDNGTAATIGSLSIGLPHMKGTSAGIQLVPFLIEMQQGIEAFLRTPWTTPNLNDDRMLTCFLTGNLMREVS